MKRVVRGGRERGLGSGGARPPERRWAPPAWPQGAAHLSPQVVPHPDRALAACLGRHGRAAARGRGERGTRHRRISSYTQGPALAVALLHRSLPSLLGVGHGYVFSGWWRWAVLQHTLPSDLAQHRTASASERAAGGALNWRAIGCEWGAQVAVSREWVSKREKWSFPFVGRKVSCCPLNSEHPWLGSSAGPASLLPGEWAGGRRLLCRRRRPAKRQEALQPAVSPDTSNSRVRAGK